MNRVLLIVSLLIAQAIPTTAQSREKDLDRWVERDLIPFVSQQLIVHPRFKGETVMFVVLRDNAPAPVSNALALSLRDRMLHAAVNTKGVSVGWQQISDGVEHDAHDCTRDRVHYYIGIELTQNLDSSYSVNLRALDLEDRNWVTGFGRHWQGRLSASQRQAMRQKRVDRSFLGSRDIPFTMAETDLLAAHIAHELSCRLQQGRESDYIVPADANPVAEDELAGAIELVSNNLANREALQLTSNTDFANADLHGKAHPIDGDLYQYWVTITPRAADSALDALSTSAYIRLPWQTAAADTNAQQNTAPPVAGKNDKPAARNAPAFISIPNAGDDAMLTPLTLISSTHSSRPKLRSRSQADVVVFFLAHQANRGLQRIAGPECRERTAARLVRNNETLELPLANRSGNFRRSHEVREWLLEPDSDTYYALAVSDARAARRIANHIDQLPARCTDLPQPGLDGEELRQWLSEFARLAAHSSKHLDWRAVSIQSVL